jgi:vacuolar-type H+-ATPase catalytic subunit A/Vma1
MATLPETMVVAEMITNDFVWHGAGATCDEAREALLSAWAAHRAEALRQFPMVEGQLPSAEEMPRHFKIHYREFARRAGYRDGERVG